MTTATGRPLAGEFTTQFRGDGTADGVWRLTAATTPHWTLYLRGVRTRAGGEPATLTPEPGGVVEIDWSEDDAGATLTLGCASPSGGRRAPRVHASVAILHEPIDGLYADLPLAEHDRAARRFWIRIMRLAGLPGGGWLIAWLARRRAARAAAAFQAAKR